MDLAVRRQAIADWRDSHMLATAALINLRATEALAAFEREVGPATQGGRLFETANLATNRIDALLHERLRGDLENSRTAAANELSTIHPDLTALATALRAADIVMPRGTARQVHDAATAPAETRPASTIVSEGPWLSRLPQAAKQKAVKAAATVNSGAGAALFDVTGTAERLRKAARQRVKERWVNATDDQAVLAQAVLLFDQTANAARLALS